MPKDKYLPERERLKSGMEEKDREATEELFEEVIEKVKLTSAAHNELISHFYRAFDRYLDQEVPVEEICRRLDPKKLGDFYTDLKRESYMLDNAAIIYPLGMKYGQMPMFRLSVELKEEVDPIILQMALDFTLKRFPTFSAVVKAGFFWHYLETTRNIIKVEEEKELPCKPISIFLRSARSFRVLYYKKRISVEFFHVLTDGTGGMVFLKTLLAQYLELLGKSIPIEDEIRDINEEVDPEELVNEFDKAVGDSDFNTFLGKNSVQLDGKLSSMNPSDIIHIEMSGKQLKEAAHSYGGTITAYILAIQFLAAKKCVKNGGLFNIQVPVNMRKYNGSKTLRNYSMYFQASMELKDVSDKRSTVAEMMKQFKEKGTEEYLNQMMTMTGRLIDMLKYVPLFLKVPVCQIVYGYLGNNIIGSTISNLGIIKVPDEMREHIRHFDFLILPGSPNRVTTSLISFGDIVRFTLIKASEDPSFEEEVVRLLKEDGLNIRLEGSPHYGS